MSELMPDGLPVVDGERHFYLDGVQMDDLLRQKPNSATECLLANVAKRHTNIVDVFVLKSVMYFKFIDRPNVWERYDIPGGLIRQVRRANDAVATEGFGPLNELRQAIDRIEIRPLAPSRRKDYAVPGGAYRSAPTPAPRPERRGVRRPNLRYREMLARSA